MHIIFVFKDVRVREALACIKNGISKVNESYTASVLAYSLGLAADPDKTVMLNKLKDWEIREGIKYIETFLQVTVCLLKELRNYKQRLFLCPSQK